MLCHSSNCKVIQEVSVTVYVSIFGSLMTCKNHIWIVIVVSLMIICPAHTLVYLWS